jgi:vacuolar protein sorting-associated protein VTA1
MSEIRGKLLRLPNPCKSWGGVNSRDPSIFPILPISVLFTSCYISPPASLMNDWITMATNIPAKLKTADLTRFLVRASQLETVKPVIAYWCKLPHSQIHLEADGSRRILDCQPDPLERPAQWRRRNFTIYYDVDGQARTGTVTDVARLTLAKQYHQIKSDNATNDAIVDDTAGQAYVEQFGLETFQRADRAVQADKVTKQGLRLY